MTWGIFGGETAKTFLTWVITQAIKKIFGHKYNPSWNQYVAWVVSALLTLLAAKSGVPIIADPVASATVSGPGANFLHSAGNYLLEKARRR